MSEIKDKTWFEEIFDKHYEAVRNYLYYMCGDMKLSEDLGQDVFLTLWENKNKLREETLRAFLFTIARNRYFKHHRRKSVNLKFSNSLIGSEDKEYESPEYLVQVKEFDEKLQNAISKLPERSRTIFLMNRLDDLSYRQISENLNISVKAVEKQMTKAIRLLHDSLDRRL
ncbi:RNA polymerase sigma factor [Sunxiuqinia sp. A32]|uniref:RNA polymerase sigma factor n=1 Tax=Sunxiuqinia sp. A32 TaxID=3461496 RepID=UPI0040458633